MNRLTWQSNLTSLLQLALLSYYYTDPSQHVLNDWLYLALLVISTLVLVWLAYQAFQAERPGIAAVATVLASPGLFIGLTVATALRCGR